jgi:hypothetical protein
VAISKGQKYYGKTKAGKVVELTPNTPAFNAVMKLMGVAEKVEMDADVKGEHSLTHSFSGMSDEQLQAIIRGEK